MTHFYCSFAWWLNPSIFVDRFCLMPQSINTLHFTIYTVLCKKDQNMNAHTCHFLHSLSFGSKLKYLVNIESIIMHQTDIVLYVSVYVFCHLSPRRWFHISYKCIDIITYTWCNGFSCHIYLFEINDTRRVLKWMTILNWFVSILLTRSSSLSHSTDGGQKADDSKSNTNFKSYFLFRYLIHHIHIRHGYSIQWIRYMLCDVCTLFLANRSIMIDYDDVDIRLDSTQIPQNTDLHE